MIKKIILLLLFQFAFVTLSLVEGQNVEVQNAYMYLGEKNYAKAKTSADASVANEKTKEMAKAWLYRGQAYKAIFSDTSRKVNALDADAAEKAVESFVRCYQLDKEKFYKDDLKGGLAVSAGELWNKTEKIYLPYKEYEKAIAADELLKTALPYDADELLKRRNVTAENIMWSQYRAYYSSGNNAKAKETGNKLMSMNYKVPAIYSSMAKLNLSEKDTAAALSSLDKGLALFEDNMDLIEMQIDILMKQKKTDVLKQKLESAVEINPNSDMLHAALANLYDKLNEPDKSEKEYLEAIDINPKNEYALFNLGAKYFNQGNEWNKKLNDLPPSEKAKAKDYETKSNDTFRKAATYFEKYYQLKPDAAVKQRLRKVYILLGENEKADKYK
ncbi:MAG: hypothetical protein HY063_03270 [Bacteroidetes bacterium]|nr:hypothetical protein [Bacteroidota bacterium]